MSPVTKTKYYKTEIQDKLLFDLFCSKELILPIFHFYSTFCVCDQDSNLGPSILAHNLEQQTLGMFLPCSILTIWF